jgi:phage tail sheath protein FI
MATYSRPGIYIQEVELPQVITLADNGTAVGAFVGALAKGPTSVPVLLNSWSEFTKTFGGLDDAYPTTWAAYNFFANGGRQLYVKRLLGASSAIADVTFQDSAVTPDDTLTIKAASAGSWGNDLAVAIVAAGATGRFGVVVSYNGSVVEKFDDLSMTSTDSRYAISMINSSSAYITAVDEGSSTNTPYPPVTSATALTGGANGNALVAGDFVFDSFDPIDSPLIFNVPDAVYLGSDGSAALVAANVISYCEGRGDCFAVVDSPSGKTVAQAKTFIGGIASSNGQAAAYFPWILIPDNLKAAPGATRLQAPGPAMVGQFLATDASRGVFKTPAGYGNRVALAVATERQLTNTELDTLNTGGTPVNAIRQIPGVGIIVMGGRTLNNTTADRYINVKRSIIYVKKELERLSAFAIFENNSERLWSQIRVALGTFLRNYWQQGGLRGATSDQAYYVKCDATTNTAADILNGVVNIEVGVAIEYPAEFVVIKLGQITGSATA